MWKVSIAYAGYKHIFYTLHTYTLMYIYFKHRFLMSNKTFFSFIIFIRFGLNKKIYVYKIGNAASENLTTELFTNTSCLFSNFRNELLCEKNRQINFSNDLLHSRKNMKSLFQSIWKNDVVKLTVMNNLILKYIWGILQRIQLIYTPIKTLKLEIKYDVSYYIRLIIY